MPLLLEMGLREEEKLQLEPKSLSSTQLAEASGCTFALIPKRPSSFRIYGVKVG